MSKEEQTDAIAETVQRLINQLRAAEFDAAEDIKKEMIALCQGPDGSRARDSMDSLKRGELLEIQWEIEEVLEATAPVVEAPPEPEPEEEPEEEEDPNRPLTAADLREVYNDPTQGIMLHRTKNGDRWFLTQLDPMTGQPRTMPLHPEDVKQIKMQFEGSPYWILGA